MAFDRGVADVGAQMSIVSSYRDTYRLPLAREYDSMGNLDFRHFIYLPAG